jgi:sec-independent protein translocase protein TatB
MDIFSAKFLFVAVIALVVLGPERLPTALRGAGRLMVEFRRISAGLAEQSRTVMDQAGIAEPLEELRTIGRSVREPLTSVRSELLEGVHPHHGPALARSAWLVPDEAAPTPPRLGDDQPALELEWR